MVGEGKLRRSDILFAIPREVRQAIAEARGDQPTGIDGDDYRVVQLYGDAAHALGDMYDDLRVIEKLLHSFIEAHLKIRLGDTETGWWRKGIPEAIRKTCQTRREEDAEPAAEAYSYTDLIDLGRIIEQNWSTFQACMPDVYQSNRKQLLEDLRRLNSIRRMVMHPVRGDVPTEADFDFVRDLKLAVIHTLSAEVAFLQQKVVKEGGPA